MVSVETKNDVTVSSSCVIFFTFLSVLTMAEIGNKDIVKVNK